MFLGHDINEYNEITITGMYYVYGCVNILLPRPCKPQFADYMLKFILIDLNTFVVL